MANTYILYTHTYIYRITWSCRLSRPGSSRMEGFNDLRVFCRQSYVKGLLTGSPPGCMCSCTGYVWPVLSWWRLWLVPSLVSWGHVLCLCWVVAWALSWSGVCHHLFLCRPDLGQGCRGATTLTHTHTYRYLSFFCCFFFKLWCHWPWLLFLCQHCFFFCLSFLLMFCGVDFIITVVVVVVVVWMFEWHWCFYCFFLISVSQCLILNRKSISVI